MFLPEGMDELFEAHRPYGRSETGFTAGRSIRPAANVYESPDGLVITLEVPGIDREGVELRLEGPRLIVSGRREFTREHSDEEFVRIERGFGSFKRAFEVPADADPEGISAKLERGVLTISVPCCRAVRKIQVESEETDQ